MRADTGQKCRAGKLYALVGLMGFVGAVLRYALELTFAGEAFPWGTLCINIAGCFVLVIVNGFIGRRMHLDAAVVQAMGAGLVGAFTTLSAFTQETLTFLVAGNAPLACAYIAVTIVGCFGAACLASIANDGLARLRVRYLEHRVHRRYLKRQR